MLTLYVCTKLLGGLPERDKFAPCRTPLDGGWPRYARDLPGPLRARVSGSGALVWSLAGPCPLICGGDGENRRLGGVKIDKCKHLIGRIRKSRVRMANPGVHAWTSGAPPSAGRAAPRPRSRSASPGTRVAAVVHAPYPHVTPEVLWWWESTVSSKAWACERRFPVAARPRVPPWRPQRGATLSRPAATMS